MAEEMGQSEPLLSPLTDDQRALIEVVVPPFLEKGQPVVFQYVENAMLRRSLNAAEVVASLPYIESSLGRSYFYSLLHTDSRGPLLKDTKIQPTVVGLHHAGRGHVVEMFLRAMSWFRNMYMDTYADPYSVSEMNVQDGGLSTYLPVHCLTSRFLLEPLLQHEPLSQGCHRASFPDSSSGWDISRLVTNFPSDLKIHSYVESTRLHIAPALPETEFTAPSPFDLVASLDYLNAVWRLSFSKNLVVIHSAERVSKLAFSVSSGEELASRLSGLIEVLKNLAVPGGAGQGGDPVQRLTAFIVKECPTVSASRLEQAIEILSAATHLRNGFLHSQPGRQFVPALTRFGLSYPVIDHRLSWQVISQKVVEALSTIREEIQSAKP